jgi:DNA repair protein RecN (Recombination protein N)
MLVRLFIQNVALIDKVEVELGKGLNILTGETGAGKSIVIDSITAVIGGRFSKDIIRTGEEKAVIEALFLVQDEDKQDFLRENGFEIEEDQSLLVVREIYQNGRNVCRANGRMITVSMLKLLGDLFIDIHGQHDNQSLLDPSTHIDYLDSFLGAEFLEKKAYYINKLNDLKLYKTQLSDLQGNPEEFARKQDLLSFQISEIEEAKLKENEEEELYLHKTKLARGDKIASCLSQAYELIQSNQIFNALKQISQISSIDQKYSDIASKLESIHYDLDDIGLQIRTDIDNVESNPQMLNQIDERLDIIARLKRKYGNDIKSVLAYYEKIKTELEELTHREEKIEELNELINKLTLQIYNICEEMSDQRKKAASQLEQKIVNELKDLEMKNVKFVTSILYQDSQDKQSLNFDKNGLDKIEFLISPNLGEIPKPLSKIASGGEMARVMLAIKTILSKIDQKTTLIFDEIDTGISGKTAQAVAQKLSVIALEHQVICVTHLAHIAAMADHHYYIEKEVQNNMTHTKVSAVKEYEEIYAIGKILGGANITQTTLMHAREIKENSERLKKQM